MPQKKVSAAGERAQVRKYLNGLPPDVRRALEPLRRAIRAALPRAVEGISYGIPVFRLDGRNVVWCAGWKQHVSMYPVSEARARAHGIDVSAYEIAKGTIKFTFTDPPSAAFVKRLVKARLGDLAATPAKKKTRA
jgi:uncharacterized protein YdhG (YjbR/CyaY superfamily)